VIRKLTLAAGFAAGYVLGAKAGEQRYRQIEAKFRELAGMPAVQDLTNNLADTASQLGDKAKATVNEKVAAVGDKVTGNDDVVDLASTSKSRTGARTTSTPMAGAAASATAPDVP
jgi:hypothetical protein